MEGGRERRGGGTACEEGGRKEAGREGHRMTEGCGRETKGRHLTEEGGGRDGGRRKEGRKEGGGGTGLITRTPYLGSGEKTKNR